MFFSLAITNILSRTPGGQSAHWSRRGPIISALIQQLEINKYRALGLSMFPYPQPPSLGWFTKSNWLSVPAPGYIIQCSKIKIWKEGWAFSCIRELFFLARPTCSGAVSVRFQGCFWNEEIKTQNTACSPHPVWDTMFKPKQTIYSLRHAW